MSTWWDFLKTSCGCVKSFELPHVFTFLKSNSLLLVSPGEDCSYIDWLWGPPVVPLVEDLVLQGEDVQVSPSGGRRPFHQQVSVSRGNPDVYGRVWFHCRQKQRGKPTLSYQAKLARRTEFHSHPASITVSTFLRVDHLSLQFSPISPIMKLDRWELLLSE